MTRRRGAARRPPRARTRRAWLAGLAGVLAGAQLGATPVRADGAGAARATPDPLFVRPGDPRYDALRQRYNACIDVRPALIAACTRADDVARAVVHARRLGLPVAIRSGGHAFEPVSIGEGLVLDLSAMSSVQVRRDGLLAVGPGTRLRTLLDATLPGGRLVPSGTCGGVGVAGLALGGGYGFFSRAHGLTCDALVEATLIDATGARRSTRDEPELLWALRGGGNGHFGAVVELVFATRPAPPTAHKHRLRMRDLDTRRARALLEAFAAHAPALPRTHFAAFVQNHRALTVLVFATGPDDEATVRLLDTLRALGASLQTTPARPLREALRAHEGQLGPLPFENASAGLYEGATALATLADAAIETVLSTPGLLLQINTLGGAVDDPAAAAASSYPHRGLPFLAELQTYWDRPADRAPRVAAFGRVMAALTAAGVRRHYVNYPDVRIPDPLTAYYGASLPRLVALKRRLDPEDTFRHPLGLTTA